METHLIFAAVEPMPTDWTTIWLALITAVVTLGGPVIAFLLARVNNTTREVDKKLDTVGVVLNETHTAVNSGHVAVEAKLDAANKKIDGQNEKIDLLNAEILRISVEKATSDEQARPSSKPQEAASAPAASIQVGGVSGKPLVLPATVRIEEGHKP